MPSPARIRSTISTLTAPPQDLREVAVVHKALSDPTRIRIVALLERDPAKDSLDVVETSLGLDGGAIDVCADHGVPRSLISWDRDRYLGPERQAGMRSPSESFEELDLGGVPERRRPRIRADAEVETDHRADPR